METVAIVEISTRAGIRLEVCCLKLKMASSSAKIKRQTALKPLIDRLLAVKKQNQGIGNLSTLNVRVG
jgi:hypothetical protein